MKDAIVCISAEAVGAMEKCYRLTIEYTTKRTIWFTLSKFQALQHRMVDMFMKLEQHKILSSESSSTEDKETKKLSLSMG